MMRTTLFLVITLFVTGTALNGCKSSNSSASGNAPGGYLADQADSINSTNDSISYVLGKNMYKNFQRRGIEINEKLVAKGLLDAAKGKDTLISQQAGRSLMMEFQQQMRQQMRQQRQQQSPQQNRQQQLKERLKEKLKQRRQQQQQQNQPDQGGQKLEVEPQQGNSPQGQ